MLPAKLPSNHVSYYSILRVAPEATVEEIKRSYKQTLLSSHPDKTTTTTTNTNVTSTSSPTTSSTTTIATTTKTTTTTANIPLLKEAYRALMECRDDYDRLLQEHQTITGLADGSGLDVLDLSTFESIYHDDKYSWQQECIRCEMGKYTINEDQLENVAIDEEGVGEVAVQCDNCSLWVCVRFSSN